MGLRYVDATKRPSVWVRSYARIGGSRVGTFISRHVNWKLDPLLLRLSGGRLSSTLLIRSAVLETTGARTGQSRRNTLIYFHDGDDVIVTASLAGAPQNPSWFYNLRANPQVRFGGQPMTAQVVTDEAERARLWPLADNVFPAFARYRRDAAVHDRAIPLVRLRPRRA